MVRLDKLHQVESEIKEGLQERIEVFDPNTGHLGKRFRTSETSLCIEEAFPVLQAGQTFSGKFSDFFLEESTGGTIACNSSIAGSSIIPQVPSVSPEVFVCGNPFLLDLAQSVSKGNISSFRFSAVFPSGETPNLSTGPMDNSSEVSGTGYRIKSINEVFSSISESLRTLQAAISELSNFTHNNLKSEIEKLETELRNFKDQENTKNEYIKELESRIKFLENQNTLTIGSMKIPFEISGVISSLVVFLTSFFIWSGRWDIIRSSNFLIGLTVLITGVIFMKSYMVNRKREL